MSAVAVVLLFLLDERAFRRAARSTAETPAAPVTLESAEPVSERPRELTSRAAG